MNHENFILFAEDLGFFPEKTDYTGIKFVKDGVGVTYYHGRYDPIGCAFCQHWKAELILNNLRYKVILENSAEIALEYLSELNKVERVLDDPST